MFSKINKIVLVFSVFLTGAFFIKEVAAWVDPVDGQNIFAPLNTSSVGQTKLGGLVLNVGNATYGLIVRYGFVGIGVEKPTAMLEVGGDIKADNLTLNPGEKKGALNSREINNGEKVKTNELCFTKQGTTEDCRDGWPTDGGLNAHWEWNTVAKPNSWDGQYYGAQDLVVIKPNGKKDSINPVCDCLLSRPNYYYPSKVYYSVTRQADGSKNVTWALSTDGYNLMYISDSPAHDTKTCAETCRDGDPEKLPIGGPPPLWSF